MTKFSVLIPVYSRENPYHLELAIRSIWEDQSVPPDEVVLVEDGPLTAELDEIIDKIAKEIGERFRLVKLECNVGLGDALNEGLSNCSYELVARMDADDVCRDRRFEKQLKVFRNSNVDVCSGWVGEFEGENPVIKGYRKVPEKHHEVVKFAKLRNPINHPAVMFRKSAVQKAGGYKRMMWFEDYYLWIRMILGGARFYNLQEPLVDMRAGFEQLERRRGLRYIKREVKFQVILFRDGFISMIELTRNCLIRCSIRMNHRRILRIAYKTLRNK